MLNESYSYTRSEIAAEIGGQLQSFLAAKNRVLVGIFTSPHLNPNAPNNILCSNKPNTAKYSGWLCNQSNPAHLFLKIRPNEWRFEGLFSVARESADADELEKHRQLAGRSDQLSRVLTLRISSSNKNIF